MKYTLIALLLGLSFSAAQAADSQQDRADKSMAVVKEFMGQLKGKLQAAMKSGGPVKAIDVCKQDAPLIARKLSQKYGWQVGRTSLKLRNPQNAPDAWEEQVLKSFESRKQAGESVKTMMHFEVVDKAGKQSFRFMKAIPTGKVCLVCHGENIAPAIKAALDKNYPQDQARNFKAGDIRGAFTITQPLN